MAELTALQRLWLTETVRLREEHTGPLDDAEANRRAHVRGGEFSDRLQHRALWLAERDGQLSALNHWLQGARVAMVVMAVLAVLSGAGLAFAALGDGQTPVNVFWALGSLLGLHLLTLLAWVLGLVFASENTAALGRLWLWLSEKFSRDATAAQLGPALLVLLQRQRLSRWAVGAISHSAWLLALTSALVLLLLLMATRRYGFVWETTILHSDTFVSFTQALGAVPAWLGLEMPTSAMIRASGDAAADVDSARQAWASLLVGVLVVYGLAPRLALAVFCLWRWQRGVRSLGLDPHLPGYAQLRDRLMPGSVRLGVSDAAPQSLPRAPIATYQQQGAGTVLVAIELDDDRPWPPPLPAAVIDAGILDSRESRQALLDQLTREPPARLLIACDPQRSPDRGSIGLIAELARCAAEARIWLLPAPPQHTLDPDRLNDWHSALRQLELSFSDSEPLHWLENGHG